MEDKPGHLPEEPEKHSPDVFDSCMKWGCIIAAIAIAAYLGFMGLFFSMYFFGGYLFNKDHPVNTAKLVDGDIEVYTMFTRSDFAVLAKCDNQPNKALESTLSSFTFSEEHFELGELELDPVYWWATSTAAIEMPRNNCQVKHESIGGAEVGLRWQATISAENGDLESLARTGEMVILLIWESHGEFHALLIPSKMIKLK